MKMNSIVSKPGCDGYEGSGVLLRVLSTAIILLAGLANARGQGTITFDNSLQSTYRSYYEQGVWFRVVAPAPHPIVNEMVPVDAEPGRLPNNGTPHMQFRRPPYESSSNYVVFSLTNSSTFGLLSVDLASPYLAGSVDITFNGIRLDGSTANVTFQTPGNPTLPTFQTFQFGPDFASDLTRVEIPSGIWAMDNIIFVPEPGTITVFLLGLLALGWRAARKRRQRL